MVNQPWALIMGQLSTLEFAYGRSFALATICYDFCIFFALYVNIMYITTFDLLYILRVIVWFSDQILSLVRSTSTIVYARWASAQVLDVIAMTSLLGRLPVVSVGNTDTIPNYRLSELEDFPKTICKKTRLI